MVGTKTLFKSRAELVASLPQWGEVFLYVNGANTVYIAAERATLENSGPQGIPQGTPYTAPGAGIAAPHFPWIGDLWANASADGTFADFEIPQKAVQPL